MHATVENINLVYFAATAEIRKTIVSAITVDDAAKIREADQRLVPGDWLDHVGGTWLSEDKRTLIRPLLTDLIADVPARAIPKTFTLTQHPLDSRSKVVNRPRSLARTWEVRPDRSEERRVGKECPV